MFRHEESVDPVRDSKNKHHKKVAPTSRILIVALATNHVMSRMCENAGVQVCAEQISFGTP